MIGFIVFESRNWKVRVYVKSPICMWKSCFDVAIDCYCMMKSGVEMCFSSLIHVSHDMLCFGIVRGQNLGFGVG